MTVPFPLTTEPESFIGAWFLPDLKLYRLKINIEEQGWTFSISRSKLFGQCLQLFLFSAAL